MAVVDHALTSLLAVKTSLGYPDPNAPHDDDTFLEGLINSVTQRAEIYCNRILKARTAPIVEHVNGNGVREFLLKQWPVTAVSEVNIDPEQAFAPETVLDASAYFISEDPMAQGIGLERIDGSAWPRGRRNIRVTYTGGYTSVPADLELAAQQWVAFYKRRFEDKDLGLRVRNKGDENITIVNSMPDLVREILDGYKRSEFLMDALIPGN